MDTLFKKFIKLTDQSFEFALAFDVRQSYQDVHSTNKKIKIYNYSCD
jgi:hypothetical protein